MYFLTKKVMAGLPKGGLSLLKRSKMYSRTKQKLPENAFFSPFTMKKNTEHQYIIDALA